MAQSRLTLAEFQDLLDRLGEDWEAWPVATRLQAQRLVARSPAAEAMVAKARAMRKAVRSSQPKAPAGLAGRIVATALSVSPAAKGVGRRGASKTRNRSKD